MIEQVAFVKSGRAGTKVGRGLYLPGRYRPELEREGRSVPPEKVDHYHRNGSTRMMRRFVSGHKSCAELPRTDLSEPFHKFLNDFPFTTARMMSRQFSDHLFTIKRIVRSDFGLKKFARRWTISTESLSKIQRVEAAKLLLQYLRILQSNAFDEITTGDESWFQYVYMSNSMFATSRDFSATRTKDADRIKKIMLTVFFTSGKPIVREGLTKGTKFA
jgi:hypothetical protein